MSSAADMKNSANPSAWAEPHRDLDMLDRGIGITRLPPQKPTDDPATRIARIESQRSIDQRDHRADVFPKIRERLGCIRNRNRIFARHLQRSPTIFHALALITVGIFARSVIA